MFPAAGALAETGDPWEPYNLSGPDGGRVEPDLPARKLLPDLPDVHRDRGVPPAHHAQRRATLQIITAAEANGHARVAELNRQVALNLDKIITAFQADGRNEQQEPAGAS